MALSRHFERVIGIDPSSAQLASAEAHPRVDYRQAPAEATTLDPGSVDLLTVAQALHWFPLDGFFSEVRRVVRPGGVFAAWCYPLTEIEPQVDAVVWELYHDHLDAYWEPERRLVENGYRGVPFPFDEIEAPRFGMRFDWSLDQLVGYLGTWSPLKRYMEDRGTNPLDAIEPKLRQAWGGAPVRGVRWPILLRTFRL